MANNKRHIFVDTAMFRAIQKALTDSLPQGSEAWLYGSRARGDNREDSDWDVLVLLNKDKVTIEDDKNITMKLKMLGYDHNQEINPQLFTFEDWNQYSFTPFNNNVLTDRIKIA